MIQGRIKDIWIDLRDELFGFVLSIVNDRELAQDIVQDVFIKIQTNLHTLKHPSKLTSWAYQVTRNTIVDHYRKTKNNITHIECPDIPEEDPNNFEYSRLSDCINGKINNLSKTYKEAIVLTYLKNLSQKQLADHLGISYSGTKSRVQKARNLLKKDLLDCPNVTVDNSGKILDY